MPSDRSRSLARLGLVLLLPALLWAQGEPDGSSPAGAAAAFRAEPAPPAWLRSTSHAAAFVDTRHYLYEAYANPEGTQWLVRYVMLPEGNEAFREIEQVFLFDLNPKHKPKPVPPGEVEVDPSAATWKGARFTLVDRRDLLAP